MRLHIYWTDTNTDPPPTYRVFRNGELVRESTDRVYTDVPVPGDNLYRIESSNGGEAGRIGYNTISGNHIETGPSSTTILITLSPI